MNKFKMILSYISLFIPSIFSNPVNAEMKSEQKENNIYNYGLTTPYKNFETYKAIKDFCIINEYI